MSFSWDVAEPGGNEVPVVTQLANQSDSEGDAISLQVEATDPDAGPQALDYQATGLPPGLSIDAGSGLITGTLSVGSAGNYAPRRPAYTIEALWISPTPGSVSTSKSPPAAGTRSKPLV